MMPLEASSDIDLGALRDAYLAAQLAGDRREAIRLLVSEGLQRGASVTQLQREVVRGAQSEIGRLWQENRITIAQEHMATAISQLALAHLYQNAEPAPRNGVKVVLACVEGELHEFPARLAADALDLAGFHVRYVGASVPPDSLVSLLEHERPHFLALSVTMHFNLPALREALARVREKWALPVIIGGGACGGNESLAQSLGADAVGTSVDALIAFGQKFVKRGET